MTDPRGVCAQRAENLMPGVPYVRGWSEARRGAEALAEQLRALGLGDDLFGLRADVNVNGEGVVCLGDVRPEAVERLTDALTRGLALEMAHHAAASVEPLDGGAAAA